jgi:hypothetical protein
MALNIGPGDNDLPVKQTEFMPDWNDRRPKPEPKPKPFRHTHVFQPVGLDAWDPRPHPGSQPIEPGTPVKRVAQLGKGKLAFHHIEDEHGNRMSVWKQSLQPKPKRGSNPGRGERLAAAAAANKREGPNPYDPRNR